MATSMSRPLYTPIKKNPGTCWKQGGVGPKTRWCGAQDELVWAQNEVVWGPKRGGVGPKMRRYGAQNELV